MHRSGGISISMSEKAVAGMVERKIEGFGMSTKTSTVLILGMIFLLTVALPAQQKPDDIPDAPSATRPIPPPDAPSPRPGQNDLPDMPPIDPNSVTSGSKE